MSAAIETPRPTETSALDQTVRRLQAGAKTWAVLPLEEKIAVAQRMKDGFMKVLDRLVAASCAAKGITMGTPQEGEEWLAGAYATVRILRLTIEALQQIKAAGTTTIGHPGRAFDGRLTVPLYPLSLLDKALFGGLICDAWLEKGVDEAELEKSRASFYKRPDHKGKVALVLGAGNVNSIPPTDVITKMFNEGKVCVLKMNPVNAYVGPLLEEAWGELVKRDFLAVVYGGAAEGTYLCNHAGVDEIHITGSDKTHDAIVWGPPGPDRAARMAKNEPLLKKDITSELGNVSPVLVVPGPWDDKSLAFQAENIAGMMTNNASFNCNAGKMIVTAKGFAKKDRLFDEVMAAAAKAPVRKAWYPGAKDRWEFLTKGRANVRTAGPAGEGYLPWTLVPGLDASDPTERAFSTEPFCSIVSATEVGSDDPVDFLEKAVDFANDKLWGTLVATILIHPRSLKDPRVKDALEKAIGRLRYGAVGVNFWPAFAFTAGNAPWGAFPGSTLTNIRSGRGWVHNTSMLEHVEKVVVRYPVTAFPKPPYFPSHKSANKLGRAVTMLEETGGWGRFLPVLVAGLQG